MSAADANRLDLTATCTRMREARDERQLQGGDDLACSGGYAQELVRVRGDLIESLQVCVGSIITW